VPENLENKDPTGYEHYWRYRLNCGDYCHFKSSRGSRVLETAFSLLEKTTVVKLAGEKEPQNPQAVSRISLMLQ